MTEGEVSTGVKNKCRLLWIVWRYFIYAVIEYFSNLFCNVLGRRDDSLYMPLGVGGSGRVSNRFVPYQIPSWLFRSGRRLIDRIHDRVQAFHENHKILAYTVIAVSLVGSLTVFIWALVLYTTQVQNPKPLDFVKLPRMKYPYHIDKYGKTIHGTLDECLAACETAQECSTVVAHWHSAGHLCCLLLEHTPAYYNVQPRRSFSDTIYVKITGVLLGTEEEDGFYYFLSPYPMPASRAAGYCLKGSNFYHLARQDRFTSSESIATRRLIALGSKNGTGIFIRFLCPQGDELPWELFESPLVRKVYSSLESPSCCSDIAYVTGTTLAVGIPPNTVGYALCHGDPFHRWGSSLEPVDLAKLNRTAILETYN